MLKFADLSVDMKSYEHSLDSYMKLFPNSYMPLLIMYLSRMELIDTEENISASDPRVIVSITPNEIEDFFKGSNLENESLSSIIAMIKDDKSGLNYKDIITSLAEYFLLECKDKKELHSVCLALKKESDPVLLQIKKMLTLPDEMIQKSGKVCLFYYLFNIKWNSDKFYKRESENEWDLEKWFSYFDDSLRKLQDYSSDKKWMQPLELTDIVLSRYQNFGKIFNPFAGLASYATRLQYYEEWSREPLAIGDKYYGQEIDKFTWAIGKLRLLAHETDSQNYIVADSSQWTNQMFSNIYCTPPFGMKILNEMGKKELADSFVIRRGISSLVHEGELICVVPASFLTRKDTYDLRKIIVDQHLIDTIVMLPEGVFPFTNIKTAIIVISKKDNLSIKFVDASSLYIIKGRERKLSSIIKDLIRYDVFPDHKYPHLNDRKVQALKNEFIASLSHRKTEDVREKDYSLNVRAFISSGSSKEVYEEIHLGSIFFPYTKDRKEVVKKTKIDDHLNTGKLVTFENLSIHPFRPYIDYGALKNVYFNDTLEAVQGPAVLFALKGELRATLIQEDQVVFIPKGDICAFGYDTGEYYGEYLVNEISKHYIKESLADMELDISRKPEDIELLSILSPCPDEYQWGRERVVLQKEVLNEEKSLRIIELEHQLIEIRDERHNEYIKSLRQRKHRIQQVMNELCPAFSLLDNRRKQNGVLHDNDIVGRRTGKTVNDYFQIIGDTIDKVENMITNIVDEDEWGQNEMIKLKDFLSVLSERILSDRFVIKVNYHIDDEFGPESIMVAANREKLATVFENIIANAEKWGFVDRQRNDYCIRIDVSKLSPNGVRICIANNGQPIDLTLNRDHFFEWGVGNHTGYGTWQVKNIIEHYLGTVELKEYPDDLAGFQTEYEIVLPLYI